MNYIVKHWPFSVDDYHRMLEIGILSEDDRVELLQGEIVQMSPIGRLHAACVARIVELMHELLGKSVTVHPQNPLRLDDLSEPEPDVMVLKRRNDFYAESIPAPDDVLLLVEIADSSLEFDREVKVPLYAKAGIVEVWIVNLVEDKLEAYSQPVSESYQEAIVLP